ncbi:class I SAM-dependent methyltransferase [Actinomadura algeriensis]|uniref:Ubiquinone/menaquinone biosynthesis C-methylase UbiE n=1 Tax=Actinomadura algeriensis TaxID=1679523 RepID=A0ABR9K1N0_9ACTN|nr:class I SAM-dependent methyltransferase [Actinomadura algeriensis]MBE1536732.1 ubiquinone/menaquinone biosynthesis C-methylase UbiE [Actinomadura algeriensis]
MNQDLNPVLRDYLVTNRAFVAPAVDEAVARLGLPPGGRVLDAGTGAGGALPALARAVGETGRVLGVDLNAAVVGLARTHVAETGLGTNVTLRDGDLFDVLAEEPDFDAIWTSDVIWPGNFDDPAAVVARMGRAVRPGGTVALFYSNYYQATFLPGHSRLERLLFAASELRWDLPSDGERHYERHLAWLLGAGLEEVSLTIIPRVGFPIDADPTVRPYLEGAVWPELLESADERGTEAGLSADDLERVRALLTPGSPGYVADRPGYYLVHPTLLATGRRPA